MSQMRPRALIAEDEAVLREELESRISVLWPELQIVASVADGDAALDALERDRPDVLFLDIQMPGLSGIEVARHASGRCHVVFVTAHDEFALTAFEEGAVDYILKPFSDHRLAITVDRLKACIRTPPARLEDVINALLQQVAPRKSYLRWINASTGSELRFITVDDVCYFRSDAKYTRVVTSNQDSLIRKPVRELAAELDPDGFWQIHRSIIVNVAEIAQIQRDFRGRITLKLKHRPELLPVSHPYTPLFKQM